MDAVRRIDIVRGRLLPVVLAAVALAVGGCTSHETSSAVGTAATTAQQSLGAKDADASVPPKTGDTEPFQATAYSVEGKTASGKHTREGICAADPAILPLGSRIRVHDAGAYSGECEVADTGRAIKGREIDIYLANDREAKKFGRKRVRVEVLSSTK
jgi:3D (Asp-Asp-Asp) domain-containing protein